MSKNSQLPKEVSNTTRSQTQEGSVIKNALKMAFGTMTSRVLGLLREVLLAALFDKFITDSWSAAFRVPNLFRRLLGEGSLSVSFIPVFVEAHLESDVRAKNLVNSMYTLLLVILSVITALGLVFPEAILSFVLDPSYIAQTEKYLITVQMAQIMFLFLFFISSFAFFMGILNALGEFFLPALAPTLWNLSMVVATIWPHDHTAKSGRQLAWGVVIGGVLQCLVLVPALMKKNYLPKLQFNFFNKDALKVFKNMVPGLIGTGLLQFTTIVNLRFSSSLAEGTISYINYIDRLIELPLSIISVSLGTALLPSLSKLWSQNNPKKMAAESKKFLELNLLVSISAAAGLYSLAYPIIDLLFGRGRFTANDVLISSEILKTYCWILVFSSAVRVLAPSYYAVKNTWFPAVVSAFALAVHLVLAPLLMKKFGVHGLMISTTTTAALNMIFLLGFFKFFITDFKYLDFFKNTAKFIFLGLCVFATAQSYYLFFESMYHFIALTMALVLSGIVFVFVGRMLGIELIQELLSRMLSRFKKR